MREGGDSVEQRARFLFRTATCRQPQVDELADLVAAYEQELEHYRANAKAAEELIASGSLPGRREARSPRAGRVDHGRQRRAEPRRSRHQQLHVRTTGAALRDRINHQRPFSRGRVRANPPPSGGAKCRDKDAADVRSMNPIQQYASALTRRHFFGQGAFGLGAAALASLLPSSILTPGVAPATVAAGGLPGLPHFAPKAKRVIYLFMTAARRRSTCSTTSRRWPTCSTRTCPSRSARASGSRR